MLNKKKQILLVEDEPSLINLYQEVLKRKYQVQVASNFESAKNSLLKNIPDLILLDLIIPVKVDNRIDYSQRIGFELLKVIKKNKELINIPIIVLTNLDSPLDRKTAKQLKADDYIVKANILPIQLLKRIDTLVKQ